MAAVATTDDVARALTELGRQFELWAEEIDNQPPECGERRSGE